jgi:putative hydrolase of the HAD superfamily
MKQPKMILFDYGGTLIYEPDFSPSAGNGAIYPYICENPQNVTLETFVTYLPNLFDEIRALRGELIEIHEHTFLRYVLEHFNMKLSVSIEEAEWIIWNGISKGKEMPGAAKMLENIRSKGIRTGIISNLCWSNTALTRRLKQFFPEHEFDFVITSSEYIFRKPDPHIFEIAARKAQLEPEEIWYCGNDVEADVIGAHGAGMYPIHYDDKRIPSSLHEKNEKTVTPFSYCRIDSWEELEELLAHAI